METNLNYLFQDQIRNFAHLVTIAPQSKAQFIQTVKNVYDVQNPKIALFVASIEKSEFETIQLNNNRDCILFNHVEN